VRAALLRALPLLRTYPSWGRRPRLRVTSRSRRLTCSTWRSNADREVCPTKTLSLLLLSVVSLAASAAVVDPVASCQALRHHGRLDEARGCYSKLAASPNPYLRAEGLWGIESYKSANDTFRQAVSASPGDAHVRVRWGRFFLERYQPADAAALFNEALKIDKNSAEALLGAALVASGGYEAAAVELANRALKADPALVEARELLARMALEDSNPAKAVEEADKAIAASPEAFDAMAVRASVDLLQSKAPQGKAESPWFARIAEINPVYGEAHALAGHFFVINRRYEEGIAEYRKAIELTPRLWRAHADLGVNLMRLGQDEEAHRHLELCFNNGYQSTETVNSLRLMDTYRKFDTIRKGDIVLKLSKKESALLEPYFAAELQRAVDTYEKKYKLKLPGPVTVEVYPNHEDFAVRTMGLPGLGALGVTFGLSVAMDSPSGRPPGSFHWASTMWHELSHVYVLTATHHRVPRWFAEGLAVHEETAVSPDWGDRLDPHVIRAIADKKLLPIAELDRGFIRPSYPQQILISYFQGGKICDYINERWGYSKLLDMIREFAAMKTTPEVIESQLGMKPETFDKEFLAWLDTKVGAQVKNFDAWRKGKKDLAAAHRDRNWDEVLRLGAPLRDMLPDYVEDGSVYEFLADAYAAKGDKAHAMDELARYSRAGGRSPTLLKRLALMQAEAGHKQDAVATLTRVNYIYLGDEEQHRRLGDLLLELKQPDTAAREFQAVLALNPVDQAGAHFRLAQAFRDANRPDNAREELLSALEAAPGFRPAQKMLLELSARK
jgi:cellulose synthase operon protein C